MLAQCRLLYVHFHSLEADLHGMLEHHSYLCSSEAAAHTSLLNYVQGFFPLQPHSCAEMRHAVEPLAQHYSKRDHTVLPSTDKNRRLQQRGED